MPIGSDPNSRFNFSLQIDSDKDEATRPVFSCRFMSFREVQKMRRLTEEAYNEKDDAKAMELLLQAIKVSVVGWKHFGMPDGSAAEFTDENLTATLTGLELWELARGVPSAAVLAEADRKKSVSRSPSNADASAASASGAATSPGAAA